MTESEREEKISKEIIGCTLCDYYILTISVLLKREISGMDLGCKVVITNILDAIPQYNHLLLEKEWPTF